MRIGALKLNHGKSVKVILKKKPIEKDIVGSRNDNWNKNPAEKNFYLIHIWDWLPWFDRNFQI